MRIASISYFLFLLADFWLSSLSNEMNINVERIFENYSFIFFTRFSSILKFLRILILKYTTKFGSISYTLYSRELIYIIFHVIVKSNKLGKYENKNEILVSKILFEIFFQSKYS